MKLLDSNILIDAATLSEDSLLPPYLDEGFYYSIITRIEVLGFKRIRLQEEQKLTSLLGAGEELPLTTPVAAHAIALRQAQRMSLGDSIIAATAIVHSLPLVTRNVTDFRHIAGLTLQPA